MTRRPSPHHRWTTQLVALALLVAGWGVPLAFPHDAIDDLLCRFGERGDGGQTAIAAPDVIQSAEHCAICHSLRSSRAAGISDRLISAALPAARLLPPLPVPGHRGPDSHRLPARAPPA